MSFLGRGFVAQRAVDEVIAKHAPQKAEPREAKCIKCGCTDSQACDGELGPCFWISVDYAKGTGICSECEP